MRQATADVLRFLLDAHGGDAEVSGVDVMRATGRASGTVYPILTRLEERSWITGYWEDPAACAPGHPPRRFYTLTVEGAEQASAALAEFESRARRRSATARRPRPAWGTE